jgi:DNA-binding CsgD family transcriptional regulator
MTDSIQRDVNQEDLTHGSTCEPEVPLGYLIITNESVDIWCAAITDRRKLIGRKHDCDIVVPARFVCTSRHHAEIWGDRSSIKMRDLGSTGGTQINGVLIDKDQEAALVVGDRIWLGGLEMQLVSDLPVQRKLFAETGVYIDEAAESVNPDLLSIAPSRTLLADLTKAEFAIVLWICRGYYKDEEIGKQLHRSPNTIRTQVNSIFRKLGVHSRTELVRLIKCSSQDAGTQMSTLDK